MRAVNAMRLFSLCLGLLSISTIEAAQVTLSAEYRGEASGRFNNTTPAAGFCSRWPQYCAGAETVGLPITYTKRTEQNPSDMRDRFFIQMPAARNLQVTNTRSGESYPVKLEFLGVSQRVAATGKHHPLNSYTLQGGCNKVQAVGTIRWVSYLWSVLNPASPQACHTVRWGDVPKGHVEVVTTTEFAVVYKLSMPSPLSMKPGLYRGSTTYAIGPGRDFDFGNDVTELNANSLTMDLELDVQHAFVIDFPAGSDRIVLEPQGGWGNWLHRGKPPQGLQRDLLFRIWSSGPFNAYKICQYPLGDRCGIRNDLNHEVPVSVAVSLPGDFREQGQLVTRLAIPSGRGSAVGFEMQRAVSNRQASLHFQVSREHTAQMLNHPGKTYRGDVTVVFDAEI